MTGTTTKESHLWLLLPLFAALVVGLTTLDSGLRLDDYLHGSQIRATFEGTSQSPWWDIFFLADFEPGKRFSGAMPWWTVDDLHIRLFRPLAAASHILDHRLWPEAAWAMHVQSVVIHIIFVGLVTLLYRRFYTVRVATVASFTFAISINHASTVTWIANRNALLAATFCVATLLLYQDWCGGKKRGLFAVPLLVAGLLCAEASVGIFGLLVFLPLPNQEHEQGVSSSRRWGLLAALIVTTLVWRALYSHFGFGALNSGAYVDPVRSPMLFGSLLPERILTLSAMAVAPVRLVLGSELAEPLQRALTLLLVGCGFAVLRVGLTAPHRRWLAAGTVAILPLVASTPEERLLTIAFVGFCPAIATAILGAASSAWLSRVTGVIVGALHLVVSPALFVSYALHFQPEPPLGLELEGTKSRNLVLLSAPSVQNVTQLLESQYVNQLPRPAFVWYLWVSDSPTIRRDGCCAVVISDPRGHGREPFSEFWRDQQTPLEAGQEVKTLGFDVRVEDVSAEGYVTKARFDFRLPLEHPNLVFADWTSVDFENTPLPSR